MREPHLDELKHSPLPQLATALAAAHSRIVSRWNEQVKRILPHADQLTRRQLENSLPELLEQAAAALAADEPGATERLVAASPAHGAIRYHQEFNLDELLVEYTILRQVVLGEVAAELNRPLATREGIALNQAIDVASRRAAVAFADHQARELRAQADAMTKYLSFLSHDLRGGLNGAMLLMEVLRRDLEREPRFSASVEDLDAMRRSMLDTVATMDRFLHAEKLRRRRFPVKLEPVRIEPLLHEVARAFAYQVKHYQQTLQVTADPGLTVPSDRELLTIILHNLVANAVKYGDGKPTELRADATDLPAGVACRISVIDQGPGIEPKQLAVLFEPYTRGETYGQRGTGLGLFIARQAADLLGAKLFAESKPGDGAQFHLDLPRDPPKSEHADPNEPQ